MKTKKNEPYLPGKAELLRMAKKIPNRYSYRHNETERIQNQILRLEKTLQHARDERTEKETE